MIRLPVSFICSFLSKTTEYYDLNASQILSINSKDVLGVLPDDVHDVTSTRTVLLPKKLLHADEVDCFEDHYDTITKKGACRRVEYTNGRTNFTLEANVPGFYGDSILAVKVSDTERHEMVKLQLWMYVFGAKTCTLFHHASDGGSAVIVKYDKPMIKQLLKRISAFSQRFASMSEDEYVQLQKTTPYLRGQRMLALWI
jgi:hypothetical protein